MPRAPPSALTPSPSQPLPPTTTTSTPSVPTPSSPSSTPPVFPALHLTPLNNTFVPKQISLDPPGQKVKIGRQTNAKTVPNGTNGYFDSKVLSRAHAEVWSEENKVNSFSLSVVRKTRTERLEDDSQVFIKDVKSSNGTFINGERLSPESAESDIFELHTDDVVVSPYFLSLTSTALDTELDSSFFRLLFGLPRSIGIWYRHLDG